MFMGDKMRNEVCNTSSIDKVLDYIQNDIKTAAPVEVIEDLWDVHTFLTKIKAKQIEKNKKPDTTSSDLLMFANMVFDSLEAMFGEWECNTLLVDDRVIVNNDLVYMDINRDNRSIECIISFYKFINPVVVAETINTLKDIFGIGLRVSGELFVIDESTGDYVWGEKDISSYLNRVNGIKIKPILLFEDDTVGNC